MEFIFDCTPTYELQVFRDNFVHCDLHPGNILVQTNCGSSKKVGPWFWRFLDLDTFFNCPRLIILDCGLVVSLKDHCQRNLKDVFRSVLMGDVRSSFGLITNHVRNRYH